MEFNVKIDINENGMGVIESTHLDVIRDYFSAENEKRKFIKGNKSFIPKREYAISENGEFNIGLLADIFNYSKKLIGYHPEDKFQVTSKAKYYYEPSFLLPENYELAEFEGFPYRDIQINALERAFSRGRGIIEVGTAGGKGLVMASICRTLLNYNPTTTFTILTPTHLVDKTLREFVDEYGFSEGSEISAFSGNHKIQPKSKIIVVGQHILSSREEEFELHLANRSVFMTDECHILKNESKVNERMKAVQTNNIIGLTGSLPKNTMDRLNVIGVVGKVICKIPSRTIKNKGLKADSKVVSICIDGCDLIKKTKNGYSINNELAIDAKDAFLKEKEYLLRNKGRNEFFRNLIEKACGDGNVLIPVDLNYHEDILKETFKNSGRKIYIINGKTDKDEVPKIYKQMEHEKNAILIVKVGVMREGISINNLSYMVGYFIQKSFIRIVQLIGRIERLGGNEIPIFYDIYDSTPFSKKHYKHRIKIYKEEQIEVIEKNVTIDYNQGQFEDNE